MQGGGPALLLPEDQPFLLRFRVTDFGMGIAFSAQALLWKSLASSSAVAEHIGDVPEGIGTAVWWFAAAVLSTLGAVYGLKAALYPWAVRLEYSEPVRCYFFFGILLAILLLLLAAPKGLYVGGDRGREVAFFAVMSADTFLRMDTFAAWLYSPTKNLRKVSPTCMLACINGFVGGNLGAQLGHTEWARFFFAQGVAVYSTVLLTLLQSLSVGAKPGAIWTFPTELTPTLFLIIAPPNAAALAWQTIQGGGQFQELSRAAFYLSCFLLLMHARCWRIFARVPFSIAWWAYTFPVTTVPLAMMAWATLFEGRAGKAAAALSCATAAVSVSVVFLVIARVGGAVWSYRETGGRVMAGLWRGMTSAHAEALCPNDPIIAKWLREVSDRNSTSSC